MKDFAILQGTIPIPMVVKEIVGFSIYIYMCVCVLKLTKLSHFSSFTYVYPRKDRHSWNLMNFKIQHLLYNFSANKSIDFNGMSTYQRLFYIQSLGNRVHSSFISIYFYVSFF